MLKVLLSLICTLNYLTALLRTYTSRDYVHYDPRHNIPFYQKLDIFFRLVLETLCNYTNKLKWSKNFSWSQHI